MPALPPFDGGGRRDVGRAGAHVHELSRVGQLRTAIAETLTVKLSVWKAPRARVLAFPHDQHSSVACVSCHSTPVTMAVPAERELRELPREASHARQPLHVVPHHAQGRAHA